MITINNDEQYQNTLALVEELIDSNVNDILLDSLIEALEVYEDIHYPMEDPISMLYILPTANELED